MTEVRRRRLVQVVELPDGWEPRFVHSLAFKQYGQLLGGRSRLVKTDDTPPAGVAWYAMLYVPGLGARLRSWPFEAGTEREDFMFWRKAVTGRELLALIGAAPKSVRARLSPALCAMADRLGAGKGTTPWR